MRKFMIQLSFPGYFTEDFVKLIHKQRAQIVEMLSQGKLASFGLSMERSNAWMVMNAKDEDDAEMTLQGFPMFEYFDYEIVELAVYDTPTVGLPELMLN